MTVDNYKDYPQTIGELRSDKSDRATDWAPRDALIALLRQIDNGLNVSGLVISYTSIEEGDTCTHYTHTQTRNVALGLLSRVMFLINAA